MIMMPSLLQITINLQKEAVNQNVAYATPGGFSFFVTRMLAALMAIGAVLVLLNLVWGAFDWLNSSGDKSKLEKARDKMTQSVIGLIVLSSVLALFTLIQQFFGIRVINFTPQVPPSEILHIDGLKGPQ
jgi:hypothetical protein